MEQNQALFSLSIDPVTKSYLIETSKWAKFLAIIGMIALVLMMVFGVAMAVGMSSALNTYETEYSGSPTGFGTMSAGIMGGLYIVIAVIMFFPLLYLLRFANRVKAAMYGNDQNSLNVSFQNLKSYFKFLGILTIIYLALIILGIVFALMSMAAMS